MKLHPGIRVWIVVVLLGLPVSGRAEPLTASVVSVRFDRPISPTGFEEQPAQAARGKSGLVITIDLQKEFQVVEGIGGAFNENGGEALTHLSAEQRQEVLRSLFDPGKGAGFSYCRLPVGASDFALSAYSLDDEPGDSALRKFSIERDRKCLIPFIQTALAINPKLRLHASPWSPPGWLKTTGLMPGGGRLRDVPEVYRTYATYLRRFVEAYAEQGIRIDRLFVQNEPNSEIVFPSCAMPPEQMIRFVVDYLAPEFATHHTATEIWAGTFQEKRGTLFAHSCFADSGFRAAVRGAGFQYSAPSAVQDLRAHYPGLRVMHTEACCQNGDNSVGQAQVLFMEMVGHLEAGASVFSYWNMVLNEEQRSTWDWRQNSLITIDRQNQRVRYNPDYRVMALVGRSVRPGATLLASSSDRPRLLISFRNPDGRIVSLVWNDGEETVCDVVAGGSRQRVVLPARSLSAVWLKPLRRKL